MEKELNNTVTAVGNYNDVPTSITSAVSVVTMIDGLTITKSSDKQNWASGNLTYTVIINNQSEKPYNSPEVKDVLDTTLVDFVENSVTIDGQAAEQSDYTYDDGSGTLTINLSDIAVSESKTITFQVKKKS